MNCSDEVIHPWPNEARIKHIVDELIIILKIR